MTKKALRHKKYWTVEEDNYLKEYYGLKSLVQIANKLKRSVSSVERRVERLGLGSSKEYAGFITAHHLAKCLNIDSHAVLNWIKKYQLPHTRRISKLSRELIFIDIQEFWDWAYQNQDRIRFHLIPRNLLLPEPAWVEEARIKSESKFSSRHQKYWTEEEDFLLLQLSKQGLTQKEIGNRLGRSRVAVQRRLSRLKKKYQSKERC